MRGTSSGWVIQGRNYQAKDQPFPVGWSNVPEFAQFYRIIVNWYGFVCLFFGHQVLYKRFREVAQGCPEII